MLFISVISLAGCSNPGEGRIDVSGTVSINGQPVPSGTLVLTPKANGPMPVASRVSAGKFSFDKLTGPRPGEYVARLNPDELTIEEIAEVSQQNLREAAKTFSALQVTSHAGSTAKDPETVVVISDTVGQTVHIELK